MGKCSEKHSVSLSLLHVFFLKISTTKSCYCKINKDLKAFYFIVFDIYISQIFFFFFENSQRSLTNNSGWLTFLIVFSNKSLFKIANNCFPFKNSEITTFLQKQINENTLNCTNNALIAPLLILFRFQGNKKHSWACTAVLYRNKSQRGNMLGLLRHARRRHILHPRYQNNVATMI